MEAPRKAEWRYTVSLGVSLPAWLALQKKIKPGTALHHRQHYIDSFRKGGILHRFRTIQPQVVTRIPPSPASQVFFSDTRMAWLWLIIRIYAGYQWFSAGWSKLTGHSIAIGSFGTPIQGGSWIFSAHHDEVLKGFISQSITQTAGSIPQVQPWYAFFLQHVVLPNTGVFACLVASGETLIGSALLIGAFTGVAALFGIFMDLNYLLAGSVSINPILGVLGLFLLLAWRISGFYGVDRYLLPLLGTPWTGSLVSGSSEPDPGYT